jgi:hypothetical protein
MSMILQDTLRLLLDRLSEKTPDWPPEKTRDMAAAGKAAVEILVISWERIEGYLAQGIEGNALEEAAQNFSLIVAPLSVLLESTAKIARGTLPSPEGEKVAREMELANQKALPILHKLHRLVALLDEPAPRFDESLLAPLEPEKCVDIDAVIASRGPRV